MRRHTIGRIAVLLCLLLTPAGRTLSHEWPALPAGSGSLEIPAQEWAHRPGPRTVRVLIHYPGGTLSRVTAKTGIMLTLHNWGGVDCVGTADPEVLANRLNVVAVCVNYLQSGREDAIDAPEPYDCGYLQALDVLRALWYVRDGLKSKGVPYDDSRLFCTGGSGGGNVSLMANKLAPRTFACVVDMCGMKKLSDDVAFNLPEGTPLDARWSRDSKSHSFLSIDEQEIRFVGHTAHLAEMHRLNSSTKVVVVHGVEDTVCPYADAVEMVQLMTAAEMNVESHWITPADLDGTVFKSAGHALGDRTEIVFRVAGKYLGVDGPAVLRRTGKPDFDIRDTIRYRTSNGAFAISYEAGFPVGTFEPAPRPPQYAAHDQLTYWLDADGNRHSIETAEDWLIRRQQIIAGLQQVMGRLPSPLSRVPLDVRVSDEVVLEPPAVKTTTIRRRLSYQSDANDRVTALVFIPCESSGEENSSEQAEQDQRRPAVVCLQQTTEAGKNEPAGISGDPTMKYALELAELGMITIAPDYPSFGEHAYDFAPERGYVSGSMKAVWDNIRAVDLLQSMSEVDPERIGCIGHSLGGHNGVFTAVFEPRLKVIVSSCGFSSLQRDDIASWTGPRYMPRLSSEFQNDPARIPFDFHELIACLAPRPFLAVAAVHDQDFDVAGVREVISSAGFVYRLYGAEKQLRSCYPDVPHSFPDDVRRQAFEFLLEQLLK